MKRNENACCGNCPYWRLESGAFGYCQRYAKRENSFSAHATSWCGEHPDFDADRLGTASPEQEMQWLIERLGNTLNDSFGTLTQNLMGILRK